MILLSMEEIIMNVVNLYGRLAQMPELKNGKNANYTYFSLAVSRPFSKNKETDFFNIVAFGKTAEFICNYFKKGQLIIIMGYIINDNYIDKNGNKREQIKVIADQVEFGGYNKSDIEPKQEEKKFVSIDNLCEFETIG